MSETSERAGRELDQRIGREVFGWDLTECTEDDGDGWCERCGQEMPEYGKMRAGQSGRAYRPTECASRRFSTDIAAAAGDVVREMGRRGFDFEGGVIGHLGAYARFRQCERPTDEQPDGAASVDPRQVSDTADATDALALAISLAALRAVAPPTNSRTNPPPASTPEEELR